MTLLSGRLPLFNLLMGGYFVTKKDKESHERSPLRGQFLKGL